MLSKSAKHSFLIHLIFVQFVIWFVIPATSPRTDQNNNALALIVLLQYVPRLYLIFPLSSEIIKATGVVTKTAWAGAAYNLLLYMLASHVCKLIIVPHLIIFPFYCILNIKFFFQVAGAAWYLLSVDRHNSCWKSMCKKENGTVKCYLHFLDCDTFNSEKRLWASSTGVFTSCDPKNKNFSYGIFENAVKKNVVSAPFVDKYFYCLWWGLQQLRYDFLVSKWLNPCSFNKK